MLRHLSNDSLFATDQLWGCRFSSEFHVLANVVEMQLVQYVCLETKLLDWRSNKHGRSFHTVSYLVDVMTMYAICTLHSKHASIQR